MNAASSDQSERSNAASTCRSRREEFLLEMYIQSSLHLSRHVAGIWQCVGVVGGALAVFALDKDKPLNDYACTLAVMLCGWLVATTLDASNWFNRNITIIGNIERLFLNSDDNKLVHPFFTKHRVPGRPAEHFVIQMALGAAVGCLLLVYHFVTRVKDGLALPWSSFEFSRALPYAAAGAIGLACVSLSFFLKKKDAKLQEASPGLKL